MSSGRVAETARMLRAMLERPGPYRQRWLRHEERRSAGGGVNQAAVAQVLAQHLWDTGEADERETDLPRRLKDTVSRALSGRTLSAQTLRVFVDAFDLSAEDASALFAVYLDTAHDRIRLVRRPGRRPAPPERAYRTVALHEFHTVGAERLPVEHRTVQVVQATGRLERYRYRFDTSAVVVEVLRGGQASAVFADELPGLFGVDITLTQPLDPGETGSFEYRTVFAYPEAPEPMFRRFALVLVHNVEVHVQFHPDALPVEVAWCVWEDHQDPEPTHREVVPLGPDGAVHRYLDALEGYGVGFAWVW